MLVGIGCVVKFASDCRVRDFSPLQLEGKPKFDWVTTRYYCKRNSTKDWSNAIKRIIFQQCYIVCIDTLL